VILTAALSSRDAMPAGGLTEGYNRLVLDLILKIVGALLLVAVGVAYVRGWRRLAAAGHPPARWRLTLYLLAPWRSPCWGSTKPPSRASRGT
jgi:hypothetical protein